MDPRVELLEKNNQQFVVVPVELLKQALPPEILKQVFGYLSAEDLGKVSRVNKQFKKIVDSDTGLFATKQKGKEESEMFDTQKILNKAKAYLETKELWNETISGEKIIYDKNNDKKIEKVIFTVSKQPGNSRLIDYTWNELLDFADIPKPAPNKSL